MSLVDQAKVQAVALTVDMVQYLSLVELKKVQTKMAVLVVAPAAVFVLQGSNLHLFLQV